MAFGSVWQACLSGRKLFLPLPSVLVCIYWNVVIFLWSFCGKCGRMTNDYESGGGVWFCGEDLAGAIL